MKQQIDIENFDYESNKGLPIKAIQKQVYEMEENRTSSNCQRISVDTIKEILVDKGYIVAGTGSGDYATELGKANGFLTKKYMNIEYIRCNHKAQKIVLEAMQEYITSYNEKSQQFYLGEENSICIDSSSVTADIYGKELSRFIYNSIPGIPYTYITEIIYDYLSQSGYMYPVKGENSPYPYLPTEKGEKELGIKLIEFSSSETTLKPTYLIYSTTAQKFIYDNFPEMLKYHNNKSSDSSAA